MPSPIAPGVYVKEVSSGIRSITGNSTSTPAFLGVTIQDGTAQKNRITKITKVRSWIDFTDKFYHSHHASIQAFTDAAEKLAEQITKNLTPTQEASWNALTGTPDPTSIKDLRTYFFKTMKNPPSNSNTTPSDVTSTQKVLKDLETEARSVRDAYEIARKTFQPFDKLSTSGINGAYEKIKGETKKAYHFDVFDATIPKGTTPTGEEYNALKTTADKKHQDFKDKLQELSTVIKNIDFPKLSVDQAVKAAEDFIGPKSAAKMFPRDLDDAKLQQKIEKVLAGGKKPYAAQLLEESIKRAKQVTSSAEFNAIITELNAIQTAIQNDHASLKGNLETAKNILTAKERSFLGYAVYGFFANGGSECYIVPLNPANSWQDEVIGDPKLGTGLAGLESFSDVSMVAVPDLRQDTNQSVSKDVVTALARHCADTKTRVAIVDAVNNSTPGLDNVWPSVTLGDPLKEHTAVYYPWLVVPDLVDPTRSRTVPPCGHVAGVWARTDAQRGVHKAPANEVLQSVKDLSVHLTGRQNGELNDKHVNCLRSFPDRGIRVWGARTLATESRDFRYLNVRRLTCFLVDSIRSQTGWAVFEPNDETLRLTLRQTITSFLTDQWHHGALQGTTAAEAFYVICDKSNNPQTTIDKGEVHCDIGIAPVRPAEFVHFTIKQTAGAAPS